MTISPLPDLDLAGFTTFGIGGLARWAIEITSAGDLDEADEWSRRRDLPPLYVGEGSNLLFSDRGFGGVLWINRITGMEALGNERLRVGGGTNLMELIRWANARQWSGLEKMYGIPGSVAGAVVGNAGAYGQEIRETLVEATVWTREGIRTLRRGELGFGYRHSVLKERREWFLIDCLLELRGSDERLQQVSDDILKARSVKYPPGLRCPGSFFKNVEAAGISRHTLEKIPPEFATHGKIPAGKLLEAVGACGARRGQAEIASYHGNLFLNAGQASCRDVLALAAEYAERVFEKFGIRLEPEVLVVGESFADGQD